MLNNRIFLIFMISLLLLVSCGNDDKEIEEHVQLNRVQTNENLNLLLKDVKKVIVDVKYEPGAEPYTDKNFRNRHYWTFLESNLQSIYDARSMNIELEVPKELADMQMIQIQDKASWTSEQIVELVNTLEYKSITSEQAVYKVIFLKGYFKSNDVVKESVLGINVTGTTIVAIFKDVVEDMGRERDDNIAKFSEQSTLVHEIGHALGLVNNGVAQVEEHHDHEHGAHCTNTDCVMFWKNEGASDMISFIQNYFSSGSELLLGEKCMNDLTNYGK